LLVVVGLVVVVKAGMFESSKPIWPRGQFFGLGLSLSLIGFGLGLSLVLGFVLMYLGLDRFLCDTLNEK